MSTNPNEGGASASPPARANAPFDPRRWLDAFTEIGGGFALGADRRLAFLVQHCDGDELTRAMAQIVGHPERQDSLKATIERRQAGEV